MTVAEWRVEWLGLVGALAAANGNENSDPGMIEVLYGPLADAALRWWLDTSLIRVGHAAAYAQTRRLDVESEGVS